MESLTIYVKKKEQIDLLVAVAFNESSKLCYNKTNSVLLPPIGYYYSMFHFSFKEYEHILQTQKVMIYYKHI